MIPAALEWIAGRDTGRSSKTIWAVMMGVMADGPRQSDLDYCTPSDPDDFGRCFRLLDRVPEWKSRMVEMGKIFPAWIPLAREWGRLTDLYRTEHPSGRCPQLYDALKTLNDEGRLLDGWEKTGPGSWKRGGSMSVSLGNGVTVST